MALEDIKYPLRLSHAFFKALEFHREPKLPEPINVELFSQARVHVERLPDVLQVDLRVATVDGQPLTFDVEVVGIFSRIENQPELDASILPEFVNERALHILWSRAEQMIRIVTGQMGMNPLNIRTPYQFDFVPPEQTGKNLEAAGCAEGELGESGH